MGETRAASAPGEAPLDLWSLAHLASGVGLRWLGLGPTATATILVGFESLEAVLRRLKRGGTALFEYESWPNILADVVIGVLGYAAAWAGARVRRRGA